jgi:methyl-CpG-binding domain protein 4
MIQPLGLQAIRAKRLIELSAAYLQEPPSHDRHYPSRAYRATHSLSSPPSSPVSTPPSSPSKRKRYPPTPISHLPGTGPYALDSYRIFCANPDNDAWKEVMPTDKELIKYLVCNNDPIRAIKWLILTPEVEMGIPRAQEMGSRARCHLECGRR